MTIRFMAILLATACALAGCHNWPTAEPPLDQPPRVGDREPPAERESWLVEEQALWGELEAEAAADEDIARVMALHDFTSPRWPEFIALIVRSETMEVRRYQMPDRYVHRTLREPDRSAVIEWVAEALAKRPAEPLTRFDNSYQQLFMLSRGKARRLVPLQGPTCPYDATAVVRLMYKLVETYALELPLD